MSKIEITTGMIDRAASRLYEIEYGGPFPWQDPERIAKMRQEEWESMPATPHIVERPYGGVRRQGRNYYLAAAWEMLKAAHPEISVQPST